MIQSITEAASLITAYEVSIVSVDGSKKLQIVQNFFVISFCPLVVRSLFGFNCVMAIADIFRAKIVDVGVDTLMIELTGNQNKLDAFVKLLNGYEIKEMVRTGITGLSRGARDMFDEFDVDFDS